ncbi:MAG: protein kinase [Candidatus Zixiibacteriota bacterium]
MTPSGKQIGRFEVVAELGRGAMGVVYRATDPHLGRHVALKILAPQLAADEEMLGRFTDEARNASRLIHQNIATVFEAGPSPEGWYVAFELVEGPTLRSILSDGQLDFEQISTLILQAAEGLTAAHKAGVVHRDLKPENIMVTPDGTVKITDFGLAKRMGDPGRTSAGTILGTAYYMAPEQAKGQSVDRRADWFSLGAIAYEMTTGKRPFEGYHEMAVLYSVVNETPEPVAGIRPDAPPGLIQAIDTMLHKDPEERLSDVNTLRALLMPAGIQPVAVPEAIATPASAKPILAVLPLENKSPDPEFEFLAEGFAEDIGAVLARCDRFAALPHEKVMAGRPASGSALEWGTALNARYVLHGSLFRAGDRLKLRLNLTDLPKGEIEWTQAFAGRKDDIFEFQDQVAQEVLRALTGGEMTLQPLSRPETHNVEAYEYYLKGRDYYRREGRENLEFAMGMFDRAIEIDGRYAAAHAALADSYAQMYLMYYDRDRKWLKKAETAAKAAMMIDSNLPEAHRALGRVMMEYGRNDEAIREFETAIQQNPDFQEAYRTLAWIYQGMRKYDDSINWGQKSLRLKPMDRETYLLLGLNYLDLRDWDKARHHLERAIELSPDYGRAYMHLGNVYQKSGNLPEALRQYRQALRHLTDVNAYVDFGWAQVLMRDFPGARDSYDRLIAAGTLEFIAFYNLGVVDLLEGYREKGMGRFESAIAMCRKQLTSDPDNPYCLMVLAQSEARLGKRDDALAHSSQATRLESGNGAITLELARVHANMEDADGARRTLELALQQPMGPSLFEIKADPHFDRLDLSPLPAEPANGVKPPPD